MIIMPVKEGENIEKALKKFKRKYERTGGIGVSLSDELRNKGDNVDDVLRGFQPQGRLAHVGAPHGSAQIPYQIRRFRNLKNG